MNENEDTKTSEQVGKKLKELREERNLTQVEVATQSGINITHYAKTERGETNTTIAKLRRICKVLKVKSSDILPF